MKTTSPSPLRSLGTRLGWVVLYAVAMGLLEAICVVYLRRLIALAGTGLEHSTVPLHRLRIEILREACTIVMLVAVAWLAGANVRHRLAWFLLMFGVWDILYYVGLKWLAGWPSSWMEWDCLFLIPRPWYGPVLAPVLISAYFALVCGWVLVREALRTPLRWTPVAVSLQLLACVIWYGSFVKDSVRIASRGYVGVHYSWALFAGGLVVGMIGLWFAARSQAAANPLTGSESPGAT